MANARVVMLEGSNGQSFFLKETLLAEGLADHVDLVSRADQAVDLICHASSYDLIVINLVEAWAEGMQLGFWLSQQTPPCPTLLIVPVELDQFLPSTTPFVVLSVPLSLHDFATTVRATLQSEANSDCPNVQTVPDFYQLDSDYWSDQSHSQEQSNYLTP